MPTVVHVGPISSPGGIQTVIGTLSAHPPEGWNVETVESHSRGSYLSKLQAYNKAKQRLEELIKKKMLASFTCMQLQIIRFLETSSC